MLALAHYIKDSIARGECEHQADAAERLGLSPARVSQMMNLTYLAPDIQEKVLFMERVDGIEPITEHMLRGVDYVDDWREQREMFGEILRHVYHSVGELS